AGGSAAKGGNPEAQNGQAERRSIRRRHKLRLKEALLGRSRGGLTSKIHLAADRRCRPLALVLTAGQAGDSPQFVPVLARVKVRLPVGRPRTTPGAVAADKAYSSRGNRSYLRRRGIKAVIPEKRDQAANRKKKGTRGGRPFSHDADLYKERNTVERLINKLKAWRGIATRCDKSPDSYLAGLHLRAAMIWIDHLIKTTE
ncbi:IS5 family transposase, partial [Streptomyces sp. NPDC058646]|uniref:IS5 family transposase n=1 Tax=Streptomyces sp. NPDC058646 TaxID=3346574 RepID=UPI00365795A2